MFKLQFVCFSLLLIIACASSPSGNSGASPEEAQAAAQSALDRMDGRQPAGQTAANQNPAQQGAAVNTGNRPAWVDSVDSVYNRSQFVAALGHASNREMAERSALANLVAFFGQTIIADQTITNTYHEAIRSGVTTGWTDNIAMENTIRTSASMDSLVGAEVRDVWHDTRANVFYAVAVMDRARTAQIYRDMIIANQEMIRNLTTMSQAEKNSLEGYSRYQFAAAVADINTTYVNLLNVIGVAPPSGHVMGNDYRLEAQNIIRAIPINIVVRNDRAGRIQSAFARSVSELGFRSGGANSRYVLNVDVTVSPVNLPNNPNVFSRMELTANLTDSSAGGVVLLPYGFNNREGHSTQGEADNRTYIAAERQINAEYRNLLSNHLSQLLPRR